VDAGNGNHFISTIQVVNKAFLLLLLFSLRADKKEPEY